MRESLLSQLRCPSSGSPLQLEVLERRGQEIETGALVCPAARYAIRGGVPRFVGGDMSPDQEQTVRTFSAKWAEIPDYAANPAALRLREAWFYERFGFQGGDEALSRFLQGRRRILEAGVGAGIDTARYLRTCQAELVALDISDVVDTTRRQFGDRVHVVQADLGALPFPSGWFDVISCDQVLHHTPDPPAYLARLVRGLAPGGHLLLYVYRRKGPLREFADDLLRGRTIEASEEEARDLCRRLTNFGRALTDLHATVTLEDDLPELGIAKGTYDVQRLIYDHIMKCFWNEALPYDVNVMVNYDWYRPKHAFRYTLEDVRGWCSENGLVLEREHVAPSGISVIARRPGA